MRLFRILASPIIGRTDFRDDVCAQHVQDLPGGQHSFVQRPLCALLYWKVPRRIFGLNRNSHDATGRKLVILDANKMAIGCPY